MAEVENRIGRLERTFARVSGATMATVVLLLAFFGYTHWRVIPNEVEKRVKKDIENYIKEKRPQFDEIERVAKDSAARAEEAADVAARSRNNAETAAGKAAQIIDDAKRANTKLVELARRYEERLSKPASRNVHFLKEIGCGQETEVRVPVGGTTTNDWEVVGVSPRITSKVEDRKLGDNAIYSFSLTTRPIHADAWSVKFDVEINYNTRTAEHKNAKAFPGGRTTKRCGIGERDSRLRDPKSSIKVIAIRKT